MSMSMDKLIQISTMICQRMYVSDILSYNWIDKYDLFVDLDFACLWSYFEYVESS
jgi:hypothetical protein